MAETGNNQIPQYLAEKRLELIWALSLQDYNNSDIALIFGLNPSSVGRAIEKKPAGWKPKWKKDL